MEKILKILPFLFIFLLLLSGYYVYDLMQEHNLFVEERGIVIRELKEKIALLEIQSNFPEDFDSSRATEEFNQDYRIRKEILERSSDIKGVYMTKTIANAGPYEVAAQEVLGEIKRLLNETELNAVVIDVKEVDGFYLSDNLEELIFELHENDVWVIARMVAFRDNSLVNEKPDFYLKNEEGELWKDSRGYYWLDPSSFQAQKYLIDLSYRVIDLGFDEIQYDYIRFPVERDGIIYPFFDETHEGKREVIRNFSLKIRNNLRDYKPDIVLSVDLFGEVATLSSSLDIGQNIADFVDTFDYVSLMIYPSHYFGGFSVVADLERGLPDLYYPYESDNLDDVVSNHPYEIVSRSIYSALDFIDSSYSEEEFQPQCLGKNSVLYCSQARIRPWLQDFNLKADSDRGIFYDAEKVRAQIDAAEESGAFGWLLWNPSNVYTEEALQSD